MTSPWACALVMVLAATSASGQPAAPREGLNPSALSTVFVLDDRGAETTGRLLRFDEQSILLLVNGQERRIGLDRIVKIDRRGDSLRNGFVAGAVLGAAIGALTSGLADCRSGGQYQGCHAGGRVVFALVSAGVYGAVGTGIDAAIPGRTTLYRRPATGGAARPLSRGTAIGFSLRW